MSVWYGNQLLINWHIDYIYRKLWNSNIFFSLFFSWLYFATSEYFIQQLNWMLLSLYFRATGNELTTADFSTSTSWRLQFWNFVCWYIVNNIFSMSFRCGVFIPSKKYAPPRAKFFVFQTIQSAKCPAKYRQTKKFKNSCIDMVKIDFIYFLII